MENIYEAKQIHVNIPDYFFFQFVEKKLTTKKSKIFATVLRTKVVTMMKLNTKTDSKQDITNILDIEKFAFF